MKQVKTRVPAEQLEIWDADAEALDMSRAEFIRCMVQAGRRKLELVDEATTDA